MNKFAFFLVFSVFYGVFAKAQNYIETSQKVLIKEAYVHNVITETVFGLATEQVMMRQGFNMGATFYESTEYVLTQEAYLMLVVIPPQFAEIIDTIVVREACGGVPAQIRTYTRAVLTVPEIVHEIDMPAIYEAVIHYLVLQNGTGVYVNPKYSIIEKAFVTSPAFTTQTDIRPELEIFMLKKCNQPDKSKYRTNQLTN